MLLMDGFEEQSYLNIRLR